MELLVASATVLGVAILAVVVLRSESHQRNKKFEAVFSGREQLSIDQFYERYFKARGIPLHVVSGVRKIVEEQLLADMSRLTDTDDFSKNLNFFFDFDSMVDVEIVCALEKEFGIEISDEEAINTKTINDMMQLVCRKLEVKDAA